MHGFFNPYYWSIALGILTLGDIVVVPAIYFAVMGKLDFLTISLIIFVSNLASDVIWYFIGGIIPIKRIENFFLFRNKKQEIENPSPSFKRHGMRILFYSKFIYGIRPLVRVLCGIYRFSFAEYMGINVITTILWITLVSFVALFLSESLEALRQIILGGEIVFTIFVVLIICFQLWAKGMSKKTLDMELDTENPKEGNS